MGGLVFSEPLLALRAWCSKQFIAAEVGRNREVVGEGGLVSRNALRGEGWAIVEQRYGTGGWSSWGSAVLGEALFSRR
jgi:hypothetical protein